MTAEEAEVIDCEKEPLDCVTWRVVKKEPVLPESGKRDEEGLGTTRAGTAAGELWVRSVVSLLLLLLLEIECHWEFVITCSA